jgi:hypothetical protein
VTDFREELTWIPRRLGAAGALGFVYVFLRLSNRSDTGAVVVGEFLQMFLRSAMVAASFMAISSRLTLSGFLEFFPLSLAFVLVFTIFYRLKAIGVENRGVSFLNWLLLAKFTSLDAFASSLRHLPLTQESMLLREPDLRSYDGAAIARYLASERRMTRLSAMRSRVAAGASGPHEAAEHLVDVLEKHGMSHVGLVSAKPLVLLTANCPLIPGTHLEEIKLNVVLRLARLLAGRGSPQSGDELAPDAALIVRTAGTR